MKKVLNILNTISLSAIMSTNIIACNISNTNNKNNKPTELKFTPQQTPINSNWKLIDSSLNNIKKEFKKFNNKWYFIIWIRGNNLHWIWQLMFFKYDESAPRITGAWLSSIKSIYCWNGVGEPQIPIINTKTGEIENWNEKI